MALPPRLMEPQVYNEKLETLLKRVVDGEQSALSAIYDITHRQIYGLVLRVLNDTTMAEEVLLDVYTQVWRQAAAYDRKRGTPFTWLMIIARCRAIDRLRANRQEQQRSEPLDAFSDKTSEEDNPEEATIVAERQKIVRSALEMLTPDQRSVIELAYFSGYSHNEIAARLNEPLGTIKTRIRAAMMKLRDILKPVLDE